MKIFCGVDVGANGGVAVIKGDELILHTIPKIGTVVDYASLSNIFWNIAMEHGGTCSDDVYVCIEDVHSIFGSSAKSNFSFGFIKGIKVGIVSSLPYKYEMVQPKVWQKEIWTHSDMVKKANGRNDTKKTSLLVAKRLFPEETFLATARCSVPHDGLFDSALIAEYCRRKFR